VKKKGISSQQVIAVVIGNALEWYSFVVYSFMTILIARLFFPAVSHTASILAATATFGVAFCMRPVGGIVLGMYADRHGRKGALTFAITLMALSLLLIASLPTYHHIGLLAPLLMVCARMLQGFSAGGEFGVSTSMLVEMAPEHQRGFYGSWQMVGQMTAMMIGAFVGYMITNNFTDGAMDTYGWRIPFLVGLLIAPVGIYIRRNIKETHTEAEKIYGKRNHFWEHVREHWRQILVSIGLVVGGTVTTYINVSYLPTYAANYLGIPLRQAFMVLGFDVMIMVILIPLFGILSDRIGRKPILVTTLGLYLAVIYPLFYWLNLNPDWQRLFFIELVFCVLLAGFFGVFATAVAELFPKHIRSSGLGISYNLTVMLFGGFAQFIVTGLIAWTAKPIAIVYYLLFAMTISFIAAIFYIDP
jgi:MFS family permease